MIHIVVVDDHPLLQEGVKKVVGTQIDMAVTGQASGWEELLPILQGDVPDIVLLDITLPGKSGLEILADLAELYPRLPVLILSIHAEQRFALRALKAGAMGYLNKESVATELVQAIRKIVTRRRRYISSRVAELLTDQVDGTSRAPLHALLSDREFQVMCEIARGKSAGEIATAFCLSPQTVYSYRTAIKEKMRLTSNVEMTRYAIENNLID